MNYFFKLNKSLTKRKEIKTIRRRGPVWQLHITINIKLNCNS